MKEFMLYCIYVLLCIILICMPTEGSSNREYIGKELVIKNDTCIVIAFQNQHNLYLDNGLVINIKYAEDNKMFIEKNNK